MFRISKLSSIVKKTIMAVTGLMLLGFVLAHLAGNLLVFAGQDALNNYAVHLRDLGALLWVARAALLAAVFLHILMAVLLSVENKKARPVAYHKTALVKTTYAARTMAFSGFIVLAYIIYHLLHFTFGVTHPAISHGLDPLGRHDVYNMVVLGFREPAVAFAYVFSMALLSLHLSHGFKSLFQSLGLNDERLEPRLAVLSRFLAAAIFIGYSSIPMAIYFGAVKPAGMHA